jgi:hypothetical protein
MDPSLLGTPGFWAISDLPVSGKSANTSPLFDQRSDIRAIKRISCIMVYLSHQNAQIREAFEFLNEALASFYDDITKSIRIAEHWMFYS